MSEKCKEEIRGEGQWGSFNRVRCRHNVKKDGYCAIHHPDAVKKRREKSDKRFKDQQAAQKRLWDRETFDERAGDRCRELGIKPEEICEPIKD